jgi:hypothetical protein
MDKNANPAAKHTIRIQIYTERSKAYCHNPIVNLGNNWISAAKEAEQYEVDKIAHSKYKLAII